MNIDFEDRFVDTWYALKFYLDFFIFNLNISEFITY